jgi:hypothetical protein
LSLRSRLAVSAFIVWNIAVILLTNSQTFIPPMAVMTALLPYARATRLMQRWALFCPEPRRFFSQYFFEVTFKDGTQTHWSRPESPNWDFFGRHHASNWQKFDTASNHMEDPRFRADLAAWVAGHLANEANPPERIVLIHHIAPVPPPPAGASAPGAGTDIPIFDYAVTTREFRK